MYQKTFSKGDWTALIIGKKDRGDVVVNKCRGMTHNYDVKSTVSLSSAKLFVTECGFLFRAY